MTIQVIAAVSAGLCGLLAAVGKLIVTVRSRSSADTL